jgi:hypothetical protein
MVRRALGVLSLALLLCPAAAAAQDAKSGDLAKQLTQLLDSKKLDTIAVADTQSPGTYVAALYFPGTQLLVVSAKYTQPSLLSDLIARKDFKGVYVELTSASIQSSKLLVMDAYANGLSPKPSGDQPADAIDRAGKESRFDGAWKKAKIPEADYMKSFTEADTDYTRLLQMLLTQLKSSGT